MARRRSSTRSGGRRPRRCWACGARYELTGDVTLLDRLDGTLRFVETALADPVDGEWFWSVRPDGSFGEKGDSQRQRVEGELSHAALAGVRGGMASIG